MSKIKQATATAEELMDVVGMWAEVRLKALMPFANLDIRHLKAAPDDRPIWQLNETSITVGHIRAAKRAMNMPVDEFDASKVSGPTELPPLGHFSENP